MRASAASVVILVLGVAACAPAPAPSASAAPTPLPSRAPVTVTLVDSAFSPDIITVPAGTTVVFVNNGRLRHTASHGLNGQLVEHSLFDFLLDAGASARYSFDTAGTYPITCIIHPITMNMTITVEG